MEERRDLTDDELDAQSGEPVPDREAMSAISIDLSGGFDNFAMPINQAIAVNNESIQSIAIADADQIVDIDQVDED